MKEEKVLYSLVLLSNTPDMRKDDILYVFLSSEHTVQYALFYQILGQYKFEVSSIYTVEFKKIATKYKQPKQFKYPLFKAWS